MAIPTGVNTFVRIITAGAASLALSQSSGVRPVDPQAEGNTLGMKAGQLDTAGLIVEFADHSKMICPVGEDTGGLSFYMAPPGSDSPSGPTKCDVEVPLKMVVQITTPDGQQVKCEGDTVNPQHPSRCEIK